MGELERRHFSVISAILQYGLENSKRLYGLALKIRHLLLGHSLLNGWSIRA